MPIFYLKWKIHEPHGGCTLVRSKAFHTLTEAICEVYELVRDYDKNMDCWEDSSSTTGEYIVDLYGYGKGNCGDISITLELANVKEEP